MNETPSEFSQLNQPLETVKKKYTFVKVLLAVVLILVLMGVVGYGVYLRQENDANIQRRNLQSQIDSLKQANVQQPAKPTDTTTNYQSKIGSLNLKLPIPYVLIVNVDGNKGGAPGSTFRIGQKNDDGSITDNVHTWTQIETGVSYDPLQTTVNIIIFELKSKAFANIITSDTTVDNISAKLITATSTGTDLSRRIYVVKSGDFVYTFTSSTDDTSKDSEALGTILRSVTIKEKQF